MVELQAAEVPVILAINGGLTVTDTVWLLPTQPPVTAVGVIV